MAAKALSVSSDLDILAQKSVQTSVADTIEPIFRPISSVDLRHLQFFIPVENDTNIRGLSGKFPNISRKNFPVLP